MEVPVKVIEAVAPAAADCMAEPPLHPKMELLLVQGPRDAIRWTKATLNLGLKAQAAQVLDAGLAYEMVSMQTPDHREAIEAFLARRTPQFGTR